MSRFLTNQNYIKVWLEASKNTINKTDLGSLRVHIALSELQNAYISLDKRIEIFEYLQQAAKNYDRRGMFLLGLAYSEGFGCSKDLATGDALVQTAARWLNCDLAINYLNLKAGRAYLYGDNVAQSFEQAIKCFKQAGSLAAPELELIARHLQVQQQRLATTWRPHLVCAS